MHNSLKDKILDSIDIVEVIGERVSLTRRGKEFIGLCPFHPDHKPSMNVSPGKQIFKCFSCGAGGDVIKFVQKLDRIEFREALQLLARRAGIDESTPDDRRSTRLREQLLRVTEWASSQFVRNLGQTAEGKAVRQYARDRGISDESIERFRIGCAPESWNSLHNAAGRAGVPEELLLQVGLVARSENGRTYDRFRNRLMLPIRDGLGRTIAFGGRAMGDDPAKYLNSPETALFSKSRVLYGLDLARGAIEKQRTAIVVEGYLDAVLLHQHGFENVVATLGTALTDRHAKMLTPMADRIVLCFDGDDAGIRAADRAVEVALRTKADVDVLVLPDGQDPADCVSRGGAEAFSRLLPTARGALEFKWSLTIKAFGDGGPRSRRIAIEEFLSFIAGAVVAGGIDPLEQGLLVDRLGVMLSVPPNLVYDLLSRARAARGRPRPADPASAEGSAYEASLQGIPAGIVAAVEEVFGLLISDCGGVRWMNDDFVEAVAFSEPWRRLDTIIRRLIESDGGYTRPDVQAGCDDATLCELFSRCADRRSGDADLHNALPAALQRLSLELDAIRMGDLRGTLLKTSVSNNDGDEAFRSLLEMGRRQNSVLSAECRWKSASARAGPAPQTGS